MQSILSSWPATKPEADLSATGITYDEDHLDRYMRMIAQRITRPNVRCNVYRIVQDQVASVRLWSEMQRKQANQTWLWYQDIAPLCRSGLLLKIRGPCEREKSFTYLHDARLCRFTYLKERVGGVHQTFNFYRNMFSIYCLIERRLSYSLVSILFLVRLERRTYGYLAG